MMGEGWSSGVSESQAQILAVPQSSSTTQAGTSTILSKFPHVHNAHDTCLPARRMVGTPPGAGSLQPGRRATAASRTGTEAQSQSGKGVIAWAYLAENKEGADIPEAGLLLQEGFQVDALKGLETADQGDKGLILRIVRDAVQEGHHGGQAGARSQHEKLTILGDTRGMDRKGWGGSVLGLA